MPHVPTQLEDLRSLYRSAFDEWASQVRRLGDIRDSVQENATLEQAQDHLTTSAEAHYRDARNRLAAVMVSEPEGSEDLSKTSQHLAQMDEQGLHEFVGMCDQFCNAAVRRGEQPPEFFALRRKLATDELRKRSVGSPA